MSFSVQSPHSGLEYNGTNFNGLFAQRRNLVNPRFLGMLRDILRFNREATEDWREGRIDSATRLGDYLEQKGYGEAFKRDYILPMVAAIWSCGESSALNFPFPFFARFFANHGMLSVNERPEWRVIRGGSRRYVERLQEVLGPRVQLNTPVHAIRRSNESVAIQLDAGEQRFDQVILACHSDQALDLLADATATELGVLGQMTYQDNSVVLHTDIRLLPRNRRAWAAWNYRVRDAYASHVALTYNMNILQNLQASETFCVSLNQDELIDPARIIQRFRYAHPVYTEASLRAQQRFHEISGCRHRTHFCGAYWFNGFHEDGVNSALRVCREFGAQL